MAPSDQISKLTDNTSGTQGRVRHPKVKTGCSTCRTRRVKCDETKPQCLRCYKYGTICGGYTPVRSKDSINSVKILRRNRALAPRILSTEQFWLSPRINLFQNETEKNYFGIFSDQIAIEIFPYFNCETWTRTIMQACATHQCIRYAAIAIGALGKTFEIAKLGKSAQTGELMITDVERVSNSAGSPERKDREQLENQAYMHHCQALEQYDKAINYMLNDITYGNQDTRTKLLICMMIICFESIHGNYKSAAAQLQAGLNMVQKFQSQSRIRSSVSYPQGYSSPCPDIVEDFLVQSFGRMEIQSMSVFDPRPMEIHMTLKHEGKETIDMMPTFLQSIEQARNYLDLITRRVMHFNGSIHVPRVTPENSQLGIKACPRPILHLLSGGNSENHNPIPWIELKVPIAQAQSVFSSESLNQEKNDLLVELESWTEASKDLLESAMKKDDLDKISAHSLKIAALSAKISLQSAFFLNESAYDTLNPEFRQIVQHASQIMRLQKIHQSIARETKPMLNLNFSFELALIPALYTAIIKCRHGPTRHKALTMLRSHPSREGVWDSVASSGLGAWVVALEEEGTRQFNHYTSSRSPSSLSSSESVPISSSPSSTTSQSEIHTVFNTNHHSSSKFDLEIPEEMRVRKAKMRFDLLERRANLFCLQMDINTGRYVEKTGLFVW